MFISSHQRIKIIYYILLKQSCLARRLMTSQTGVNCQRAVIYGTHPSFHPLTEQEAVKCSAMLIHLLINTLRQISGSATLLKLSHSLTFSNAQLVSQPAEHY